MSIYVKESSTWREIQQPYVYASGTWRTVQNENVKDAGTWKLVYASIISGELWNWGRGIFGNLGNAALPNIMSTPVTTFAGGSNWKELGSIKGFSTSAVKTDGTLWIWGSLRDGMLGRPPLDTFPTPVTTFAGGTNWADTATTNPEDLYTLSAGNTESFAVKTDGTLWVWGSSNLGTGGFSATNTPVTTFAGGTNWKQVSGGTTHTAAIKTDGTLWVWGSSLFAALGDGRYFDFSATNILTPITTFAGGTNWKQVSVGNNATAAIKTDGTLWTWGYQSSFPPILGTNDEILRSTPVTTFAGGTNWKQVSISTWATAAIKTDGTLWTWGRGAYGQLGNSGSSSVLTPVTTFAGGTNWKQVSVGYTHISAIKTDGTLWTWGYIAGGVLGTNDGSVQKFTPVTTFAGGTNWKQVSSGKNYTAAVKTDGTLWTWGYNTDAQLGTNDTTDRPTPVTTFAGGTNWKQVSAGSKHTIALNDNGISKQLFVFGKDVGGSLGVNPITRISTPATTFAGGTNWKQVSCGSIDTAAIKTDGTLWLWGSGGNGRLGVNDITNRFTPVTTFAGGTNWKQVDCGAIGHIAAIKTDGTLWLWGYNTNGNLGVNDTTQRLTPVTTFAGGTNWKQVSASSNHTVAVKTDGTLWTWGSNVDGNLGTNDTTRRLTPVTTFAGGTNWKQVNTGSSSHTLAVKTDGTLWVWGRSSNGQLGHAKTTTSRTPVTTFAGGTNWKQAIATAASSLALRS